MGIVRARDDRGTTPREVIEAALAHAVGNKVEAAYARSDLFERRRKLMDDWANYLALRNDEGFGGHSKSSCVVVLKGGCKH